MILKAGNGSEWNYLDQIRSVVIKPFVDLQEKGMAVKTIFIPSISPSQPEEQSNKLVIINFGDSVGELWHIIAPQIYLVSDEGKTIERIN